MKCAIEESEDARGAEAMEFVLEKGIADNLKNDQIGQECADACEGGCNEGIHFVRHFQKESNGERRREAEAEEQTAEERRRIASLVQRDRDAVEESLIKQNVCQRKRAQQEQEFWVLEYVFHYSLLYHNTIRKSRHRRRPQRRCSG